MQVLLNGKLLDYAALIYNQLDSQLHPTCVQKRVQHLWSEKKSMSGFGLFEWMKADWKLIGHLGRHPEAFPRNWLGDVLSISNFRKAACSFSLS